MKTGCDRFWSHPLQKCQCWSNRALLFASDLLLKPPKELVLLAIDCISALYFTATLFVGLKERKKGAVAASAVGVIIAIASFFI